MRAHYRIFLCITHLILISTHSFFLLHIKFLNTCVLSCFHYLIPGTTPKFKPFTYYEILYLFINFLIIIIIIKVIILLTYILYIYIFNFIDY